jgi:hypothetical protein
MTRRKSIIDRIVERHYKQDLLIREIGRITFRGSLYYQDAFDSPIFIAVNRALRSRMEEYAFPKRRK